MRKLTFFVLVVILLGAVPASAQDDAYPECNFNAVLPILQDGMSAVSDWETLEQFNRDLQASLAFCRGLMFSGDGDRVVDPMEIPAGLYRLVYTADSNGSFVFGSVEARLINGDCTDGLLINFAGDSTNTAETLFESGGCMVIFEVGNTQTPWTVHF